MNRDKFYEIFGMVLTFVSSLLACIWAFTQAVIIFEYILAIFLAASTAYFGYHTKIVVVNAIKESHKDKGENKK